MGGEDTPPKASVLARGRPILESEEDCDEEDVADRASGCGTGRDIYLSGGGITNGTADGDTHLTSGWPYPM